MNLSRTRAWRRAQRDRYVTKRRQQLSVARQRNQLSRIQHRGYPDPESGRLSKTPTVYLPYEYGVWLGRHKPSKDWKLVELRSQKLARAKQLKTFYPRKFWDLELEDLP